jgi:hypothetical protein
MPPFTASRVLVLVALIIELLAAFGVSLGVIGRVPVDLVPLGIAVYFVGPLVP